MITSCKLFLLASLIMGVECGARIKEPIYVKREIKMKTGLSLRFYVETDTNKKHHIIAIKSLTNPQKTIIIDKIPINPNKEYDVQIPILIEIKETVDGSLFIKINASKQKEYIISSNKLKNL